MVLLGLKSSASMQEEKAYSGDYLCEHTAHQRDRRYSRRRGGLGVGKKKGGDRKKTGITISKRRNKQTNRPEKGEVQRCGVGGAIGRGPQ